MPDKAKKSQKQPNILVIWGDDIGINNLSCYSHGVKAGAATGVKLPAVPDDKTFPGPADKLQGRVSFVSFIHLGLRARPQNAGPF
jgi:hypothetical protein